MGFLSQANSELMTLYALFAVFVLGLMAMIVSKLSRSTQRASGNVIGAGASIRHIGRSNLSVRANGIEDLLVTSSGDTNSIYEERGALVLKCNQQRLLVWKRGESIASFCDPGVTITKHGKRGTVIWTGGQNVMTLFLDSNGALK